MKKPVIVLLHIGYWVMYLLLLTSIFMALNSGKFHITFHVLFDALLFKPFGWASILPALIGFYTFYGVLFKRILTKQKILKLFLYASGIALAGAVITELIIYAAFHNRGINWALSDFLILSLVISFVTLINGSTGLVMKGFIDWYNDIKIKVELNKRNYEMELAMLKSQINPHFLFNTLNNIDVLIAKDAIRASEYLNKLTDILRFMLYDSSPEKIALSKELNYIEKFIELQKIRTANEHYINYSLNGDPTNFMIPPMILIPFIENAFKHAENKKAENSINIHVDIEPESFVFKCENSFNQNEQIQSERKGLGSEMIKKRLSLLFPGKHKLTITNKDELYKVELSLF